jgi:putative DNA primase/helicase
MTARSVPIRYERDDNQAALEVRNQSIKIWCDALPAGSHPVFERFGVSVEGLRNYQGSLVLEGTWCNGNLLVPMFDRARNLANLAFVSADGQRRYLSRPHVAGTYFSVGKYPAGTKSSIVVSGGLVAALKIREELGSPVAVAFTSSNVGAVAEIMADR